MSVFDGIGNRLGAERMRLNYDQKSFALATGISRRTMVNYENGSSMPTLEFLSRAEALGANMAFITTGTITNESDLQEDELNLVHAFRKLDQADKQAIEKHAEGLLLLVQKPRKVNFMI
ncbi:helix-turn-helix domain-containing protein [Pseudomonas luteola]